MIGRAATSSRVAWGLAAMALVAFPIARATADDAAEASAAPSVALRWSAPPTCPDAAYLEREIARLLEGGAAHHRVEVRADVTHEASGDYRVQLSTRDREATGERSLVAPSCEALADAVVLIVAMTIDPARVAAMQAHADAGTESQPDAATSDADDASTQVTVLAPPDRSARSAGLRRDRLASPQAPDAKGANPPFDPPPPDPSHVAISAFFAGDIGTLPKLGVGPELAVAYRFAPFRVELASAYFPRVDESLAASRGGSFSLFANDLVACHVTRVSRVDFGPCVGGELAWLRGEGFGVRNSTPTGSIWPSAIAGGRIWLRAGASFALRLDLAAVVPSERPQFVLDGVGSVYRPSAVAGRAALGAEVHF